MKFVYLTLVLVAISGCASANRKPAGDEHFSLKYPLERCPDVGSFDLDGRAIDCQPGTSDEQFYSACFTELYEKAAPKNGADVETAAEKKARWAYESISYSHKGLLSSIYQYQAMRERLKDFRLAATLQKGNKWYYTEAEHTHRVDEDIIQNLKARIVDHIATLKNAEEQVHIVHGESKCRAEIQERIGIAQDQFSTLNFHEMLTPKGR